MIYIGIDGGKNGALGFMEKKKLSVYDMQDPAALENLRRVSRTKGGCVAIIEKVHAGGFRKGKDGKPIKAGVTSSGTFMRYVGKAEGWLEALGIPYHELTKTKWWKLVAGSTAMGKTTDERKTRSLELARRLFPDLATEKLRRKQDHSRAEALLICCACKVYKP